MHTSCQKTQINCKYNKYKDLKFENYFKNLQSQYSILATALRLIISTCYRNLNSENLSMIIVGYDTIKTKCRGI